MMVPKGGQSQLNHRYTHTCYSAGTLVVFSLDCGRKQTPLIVNMETPHTNVQVRN